MKTTKKKTILVVYTNKKKLTRNQVSSLKKYSFNTTADVKVGDTFESGSYTTNMMVVAILDECYKYYNRVTGELSNKHNSTEQWTIRDLVLSEEKDENTIYGNFVSRAKSTECCKNDCNLTITTVVL